MGVPLYTDEDHNHFVDLYFVLLYKFHRKAFLDEVSTTFIFTRTREMQSNYQKSVTHLIFFVQIEVVSLLKEYI